jgi:hypothetical protein
MRAMQSSQRGDSSRSGRNRSSAGEKHRNNVRPHGSRRAAKSIIDILHAEVRAREVPSRARSGCRAERRRLNRGDAYGEDARSLPAAPEAGGPPVTMLRRIRAGEET